MDNYSSVVGHEQVLLNQFREEEALGMMFELDIKVARANYPNLHLAAQGSLRKGDDSWRVLHDGTHGVRLNNRIVIEDRTRMPTSSDIRSCMEECAESGGRYLSLQADVRKAHRRVLHRKEDWPLLGLSLEEGRCWINRVGTFGLSTASYWWGRLAALAGRLTWAILDTNHDLFQLIYADDLRWMAAGPQACKLLLFCLLVWKMIGSPFKHSKLQFGTEMEWIGFWIDMTNFQLGMSVKHVEWLAKVLKDLVDGKPCLIRDLLQFIGRLGFSTGALEFGKPFMGPLYTWASAVPSGTYMSVPAAIRVLMHWFLARLQSGGAVTSTRRTKGSMLLFKADAKGARGYCVLGGYMVSDDGGSRGPWFSLKVLECEAPWLFKEGEGSRRIATTEMLSSLLCLWLFTSEVVAGSSGGIGLTGLTDNAGNAFILSKMCTTKLPVAPVLLEMAKLMFDHRLNFTLSWVRRDDNTQADALTNEDFSGVDLSKRINITWTQVMIAFPDLLTYSSMHEELEKDLATLKDKRRKQQQTMGRGYGVKRHKAVEKEPW